MTTTGQALERLDKGPGAVIERHRDSFATVLPSHVNADQWVRVCQGVLRRNRQLARVAEQNPGSFLSAMLDAARQGLEPGDTYHLVPFGSEVVGIVDYRGEIELAYRSGAVTSVKAEVVRERDHFRYLPGEMDRPEHRPDWFADRGEMIGVYAYAELANGGVSRVVVLSADEVAKVRAVSKTAKKSDSPWVQWPDRMWLKTAVHQLRKWIPTSAEYRNLVDGARVEAERVAVEIERTDPEVGKVPPPAEDFDDAEVVDAEIVDDVAAPEPEPEREPGPEPERESPTPSAERPMTDAQSKALHSLMRTVRGVAGPARFEFLTEVLGRPISSTSDLTAAEASRLIDDLQAERDGGEQ